jgi:hypothetical protein
LPDPEAVALLQKRQQLLGVATLSWRSFSLLHEIISTVGVPNVIRRHSPSLRAAEKQALLDDLLDNERVLVNKTLTVRLGTMHLLCTGVGDFTLNRGLLSAVANELRLPKRIAKDCHINPADYSPEYELGLLTGMVSPFLSPSLSAHRLQAITLLTETEVGYEQREQTVAVSLSPFESLLVPLAQFRMLAQMYARRAYPALRWLEIDRQAERPLSPGHPLGLTSHRHRGLLAICSRHRKASDGDGTTPIHLASEAMSRVPLARRMMAINP